MIKLESTECWIFSQPQKKSTSSFKILWQFKILFHCIHLVIVGLFK